MSTVYQWIAFHILIAAMLAIDLGVLQRKAHAPSLREAAGWSVLWIVTAALFAIYVYLDAGAATGLDFATAYIVEKSLSVDNIFVFAVIFRYFGIPFQYQHKVLFWGILGAVITRGTFILAGVKLVETFHWVIFVFGGILLLSGVRLAQHKGEITNPEKNLIVRLVRRFIPISPVLQGDRFIADSNGKRMATPLLLTLFAIEGTDIAFALDSVPAVLVITTDLFVAYTSNIFAILGLRALYFLLIGLLLRLRYLHLGLSILLVYLGTKVFITVVLEIPTLTSLMIVATILGVAVIASILRKEKGAERS